MNRQQVVPQEQKPKRPLAIWMAVSTGFIVLLAMLWRLIFWVWSILILGVIVSVLGNAVFTALTTGKIDFMGTLTVITWLNAHLAVCLTILTPSLLLTLCSYLTHRWQRQRAQQTQHVHDEFLITKGVQRALDELKANPTVSPILPLAVNQEITVPKPIWNVPYHRNPFFTGREDVLQKLHEYLIHAKTAALTQPPAITGLGGIGKTQVAVEYAYRYKDAYQYVLWVNATSRETLIEGFVTIARLLTLPTKDEHDQTIIVAAVQQWLSNHSSWLLILDNADDLNMASDFLPTGGQGHILLTTREQAVSFLAHSIEVTTMDVEEGTLMLLRRANILPPNASLDQATQEERETARTIVIEMNGLPLALDQTGAYIEEKKSTLKKYLETYRNKQIQRLQERGRHGKDHPNPVATTWSLNFEQVERNSPVAADLLRCCAFLAPDDIPQELFVNSTSELGPRLQHIAHDPDVLEEARGELLRFSLVRYNPDSEILSIHRLVQFILITTMDRKHQRTWAKRVVHTVNHLFPDPTDATQWPQCSRYLPQALACFDLIKQYRLTSLEATHLLNQAANYLAEHALYEQAEPLYQLSLSISEQKSSSYPGTASKLYNLARLYYDQGKYEQAEPLLQRALAIDEQSLNSDNPDIATSLNFLAGLYQTQGQYEQAEPLYQRALAIYEKQLGPEHPDTATSLNNLAGLYRTQGQYEQAEPLWKRALAIYEKQLGPEHPTTAMSLNNLAGLYQTQGQYEQAEPLYQRALAICEKQLGPEHPDTATSLNNLALLYYTQGQYEQAEPLWKRALAIYEKQLGPEHPTTARSLNNLAGLYQTQGQYEQAEPLWKRALAIYEKQLGPEHPDTITVRNNYTAFGNAKQQRKRQ